MPRIEDIGAFNAVRENGLAKLVPPVPRIGVGMGTCGRGLREPLHSDGLRRGVRLGNHPVVARAFFCVCYESGKIEYNLLK